MQSLEERLARLEQEFFTNGGGEKNFTVWEIFEYDRGKESAPKQVEDWDCPMINETSENNGLTKYAKPTKVLKGNSITVSVNFAQTVFYQPKDFCASVNIMSLYNEKFSPLSYMYVITQLRKKHTHFNYWGKISKDRLLEEVITLPTLSTWEIAYEYMENYIKEIEAYHIKEIEAYLKATGLSDYELSNDEELALESILSSSSKKFRLDELFEVSSGDVDIQKSDIEDQWEIVVSAWEGNCWIIGKTNKQAKIFEKDTITIDMFWYSFLRNHPYKMVTHGRIMSLKSKNKNRFFLLYLLSSLQYLKNRYWFDNMLTWKKIKEEEISIPTTYDNQINYPLIENYITATQKLVIKDLVENIKNKLETYKQVI